MNRTTTNPRSAVTARPTDRESLSERFARTRDYADLPHGCSCGARWSGGITCHCGSCHLTFSGVEAFHRHRRGGLCHDPRDVGLTLVAGRAYECWGHAPNADPEDVTP